MSSRWSKRREHLWIDFPALREHLARFIQCSRFCGKNTAGSHDGDGNGYRTSARHRHRHISYNHEFRPTFPLSLLLIYDRCLFQP
jgi:hypothetical protein